MRTPEITARVRKDMTISPDRSAKRQVATLNISRRNLCRILHDNLFHLYKIQIVHKILLPCLSARWQRPKHFEHSRNEAHFDITGYVNKSPIVV